MERKIQVIEKAAPQNRISQEKANRIIENIKIDYDYGGRPVSVNMGM